MTLLIIGGWSLIAYLLLWWLVDEAPAGYWDGADESPPPRPAASGTTS